MSKYTHSVKIPIYHGKFTITIVDSMDEVPTDSRFVNFMFKNQLAAAYALNDTDTDNFHIIFVKKHITPGVVAHECLHITNMLLKQRGVGFSYSNDESACYLLGWFVDTCWELINKKSYKKLKL